MCVCVNNYKKKKKISKEAEKDDFIPFIQLYCEAEWLKYKGVIFHKGDIITLIIKHSD
jgi:hypothetical protein